MTIQIDSSKRVFTLSHVDQRIPQKNICKPMELIIYVSKVSVVNDFICQYFQLQKEWDKRLLKTIFYHENELNHFTFQRSENENIFFEISVIGDKEVITNDESYEKYRLIQDTTRKISVTIQNSEALSIPTYTLTHQEIAEKASDDLSIVALYNCDSFSRVEERNTESKFSRILEKA